MRCRESVHMDVLWWRGPAENPGKQSVDRLRIKRARTGQLKMGCGKNKRKLNKFKMSRDPLGTKQS